MATLEEIGERLKAARVAAGYRSAADAARALNIPYPTYAGHENGSRDPRGNASEYVRKYKITLDWLLEGVGDGPTVRPSARKTTNEVRPAEVRIPSPAEMPKDFPVLGTVAGSDIEHGAFQITADVVDYVRRPPALLNVTQAYSVYVEGESMSPRFEPGELVYINPIRPARPGDYVVVQEPIDEHGNYRSYIKQFVRRAGEWVIVRQFNPASELRFKASDGLRVHRVVPLSELLGV